MELDRVNREKEWHNETFGSDARVKVGKYYLIFDLLINDLDAKIIEYLKEDATVFLDYGCGNGNYLRNISSNIKKGIGIDISEALINYAKTKVKEESIDNIEFVVMDAMNTSFENSCFDVIHGQSILHHLDLKKSLIEIKRLLNGGG
jgi:ubiquinone/menaquinone biosynthesis C-methylase UbiE